MIKKILKTLLVITILFSFGIISVNAWPNNGESKNYYDRQLDNASWNWTNNITNDALDVFDDWDHFIKANKKWKEWIYDLILSVAFSLKAIFLALASIYLLITVLKLLFAEWSSDDEWEKFKKWFKWITVWIIVMQIAYSYVNTIYNKNINWQIADDLIKNIIEPLIKLLETAAAFFFVWVMIFAFYKMVTAGWDEEKATQWKMSVIHAFIWFIVIKLSSFIVSATYSQTLCANVNWISCNNKDKLSDLAQIIFTVINWMNWFVWIAVVLMIIFAGSQIIFSNWDEEKIKKAKKSILYIIIWIVLLIMNYLILTFFLTPELTK